MSALAVRASGGVEERVSAEVAEFLGGVPGSEVRVRLTPLDGGTALLQANARVRGHRIRAQVAAPLADATALLRERVADQVSRLDSPGAHRAWPGPDRAPVVAGRAGARRVARRKRVRTALCAPDAAALVMDLMDYDFHLFADSETGQDSVLYRVGPTGYRLARMEDTAPPALPVVVPLTTNVHPVPELTEDQAVRLLDETELPFRFFRQAGTRSGAVLYRRWDGDYGLLAADS
ncbi:MULTISPECIES: sigma 54 modulation/S30EA ribosomal C-terminal domain-containing protein [Actinosynnema]|uniref:sigma 54 modulation/S30EA ribosomal C-terminal domain-containing protein n=1 Tax=Actinosynnema TaxID=40566 RepID=UPI0020A3DDB8|nr:sigma 54 modulation/S30EA ribosomal C-terminal domain-containing protein [Actinosynnema pretiosum]MCP2099066.1 Sigma 54 modulation/S30EA ribosomal protein C terminus [Actinosynnema pretiosum]